MGFRYLEECKKGRMVEMMNTPKYKTGYVQDYLMLSNPYTIKHEYPSQDMSDDIVWTWKLAHMESKKYAHKISKPTAITRSNGLFDISIRPSTGVDRQPTDSPDPDMQTTLHCIRNADCSEIADLFKNIGQKDIADRLDYLKEVTDDDPGVLPINIDSLRAAALFMIEKQLTEPQITVSDEGLIHLSWDSKQKGIIGLEFQQSGMIGFAALLDEPISEHMNVSGTMPPDGVIAIIRPFLNRLLPP